MLLEWVPREHHHSRHEIHRAPVRTSIFEVSLRFGVFGSFGTLESNVKGSRNPDPSFQIVVAFLVSAEDILNTPTITQFFQPSNFPKAESLVDHQQGPCIHEYLTVGETGGTNESMAAQ